MSFGEVEHILRAHDVYGAETGSDQADRVGMLDRLGAFTPREREVLIEAGLLDEERQPL